VNTPVERLVLACSGGLDAATAIPRPKARHCTVDRQSPFAVADAQFQPENADCGVLL
jgi:hypothetical protein